MTENISDAELTALIQQNAVTLVQTFEGAIWVVGLREQVGIKMDFWPDSAGERVPLKALVPLVTAWRESGHGNTFGVWHNRCLDEIGGDR